MAEMAGMAVMLSWKPLLENKPFSIFITGIFLRGKGDSTGAARINMARVGKTWLF